MLKVNIYAITEEIDTEAEMIEGFTTYSQKMVFDAGKTKQSYHLQRSGLYLSEQGKYPDNTGSYKPLTVSFRKQKVPRA